MNEQTKSAITKPTYLPSTASSPDEVTETSKDSMVTTSETQMTTTTLTTSTMLDINPKLEWTQVGSYHVQYSKTSMSFDLAIKHCHFLGGILFEPQTLADIEIVLQDQNKSWIGILPTRISSSWR